MEIQRFKQNQLINQLKLQQMQNLAPIEQQLRQLELQRAQQMAPIQVESAKIDLEKQKRLLEGGLLGLTANQREFAELTQGMSQDDITKARRIKLGLDPRAVGSAIQTVTDLGTVKEVAATEKEIAGAKEEGKLISQLEIQPEIKRKITSVVASAKADADAVADQKSDNAAFNLYQTAFSGLATSLGETATGPFFGLMPAITSNQQIADGAIAAVAPILKQLFRTAGEGTFTDQDQKLLMGMIPTRTDTPEARASKISNIDSIIRAKLKQPLQDNTFELPQPIPGAPTGLPSIDDLVNQYAD
jgi:hypothetical protein